MFFLTDEQIEEIIKEYGGDVELIKEIQMYLNKLAVIETQEDYFDVICNIVSRVETFEMENQRLIKGHNKPIEYKLIDVIGVELNRKYNNFEDSKQETRDKVTRFFK